MIAAVLSWLGGKVAGLLAVVAALVFAAGFAWQSGRIDGWPLIGGGLKADVARLTQQLTDAQLAQAQARNAALIAQQAFAAAGAAQAAAHVRSDQAAERQIQTLIRKVPVYVSAKSDSVCVVPWGFVRLFDAAASGGDPDAVAAAIAPGQPDDAPSDVKLSEAVALLAANFGSARRNADQLTHLEGVVKGQ